MDNGLTICIQNYTKDLILWRFCVKILNGVLTRYITSGVSPYPHAGINPLNRRKYNTMGIRMGRLGYCSRRYLLLPALLTILCKYEFSKYPQINYLQGGESVIRWIIVYKIAFLIFRLNANDGFDRKSLNIESFPT